MGNIDIGMMGSVEKLFSKEKKKSEVPDHKLLLSEEHFEIETNCKDLTFFKWEKQLIKYLWEKHQFQLKELAEKSENFDMNKLYVFLRNDFFNCNTFEETYKNIQREYKN